MVRTVYSPEYCLQYLEQNANNEIFSLGLILGQVSIMVLVTYFASFLMLNILLRRLFYFLNSQIIDARESVIHLARTPEEKTLDTASEASYPPDQSHYEENLMGVSEAWVADHAKHVTRMLPGGMFVQGKYQQIHKSLTFYSLKWNQTCLVILTEHCRVVTRLL